MGNSQNRPVVRRHDTLQNINRRAGNVRTSLGPPAGPPWCVTPHGLRAGGRYRPAAKGSRARPTMVEPDRGTRREAPVGVLWVERKRKVLDRPRVVEDIKHGAVVLRRQLGQAECSVRHGDHAAMPGGGRVTEHHVAVAEFGSTSSSEEGVKFVVGKKDPRVPNSGLIGVLPPPPSKASVRQASCRSRHARGPSASLAYRAGRLDVRIRSATLIRSTSRPLAERWGRSRSSCPPLPYGGPRRCPSADLAPFPR